MVTELNLSMGYIDNLISHFDQVRCLLEEGADSLESSKEFLEYIRSEFMEYLEEEIESQTKDISLEAV